MTVRAAFVCELPVADDYEHDLAGCALGACEAAALAAGRIAEEHCRDPRVWRTIIACLDIEDVVNEDGRIAHVAGTAGVEPALLRSWLEARPVFADTSGSIARRVREVGERRLALFAFLEAGEQEFGITPVAVAA